MNSSSDEAAKLLPCMCGKDDHWDREIHYATCPAYYRPAIAAALDEMRPRWRPITEAKKDGTPVLLKVKDVIPGKPDDRLAGVQFVGRNHLYENGFDASWNFAAPVGYGGIPDEWLDGWMPLPLPPSEGERT